MEFFNDFIKPYIFFSAEGMLIEGTARIILWEKDRIILEARDRITVSGDMLVLDHKGRGSVMISGHIYAVEFSQCSR